jgi:tetratricopeptide (TPR) repeat protein
MTATELFEQAEIKLSEKAYKDSIQLYTEAIVLENTNAHFISQRAVAFFHMNKFEEALYDFNHAIELEPDNPFRYSSRAFMLSNMNRISEAIKDYEKAIELDPTDSVAYNNLGLLQEGVGFNEIAKQNFDKADEIEKVGLNGSTQISEQNIADNSDDPEIPILDPKIKQLGDSYKDMGYFQFIKMIFTHKKVRNDFLRFILNGFKLK